MLSSDGRTIEQQKKRIQELERALEEEKQSSKKLTSSEARMAFDGIALAQDKYCIFDEEFDEYCELRTKLLSMTDQR